jgi:hypothetical protein
MSKRVGGRGRKFETEEELNSKGEQINFTIIHEVFNFLLHMS